MSSTNPRHVIRTVTPIAAALVLISLTATPSSARQDAGPSLPHTTNDGRCRLQRVDTQFVRCDDLTGNGVPAPGYVPER
jgi:hypothetical protein